MNQNRNQNRRRGRSNRGPGGGSQGNRIDSRARGNAPQMLEKYKKLAHDSSLNGDRVQTEYYLQFADHYFRVIADNKSQKDDQQPQHQRGRHNERDQDDGGDDNDNDGGDRQQQQRGQRGRGRRDEQDDRNDRNERDEEGQRGSEGDDAPAEAQDENPFVRESKPRRGRPRKNGAESDAGGLDPASLPPSIGKGDEQGDDAPPRRRARPARAAGDKEEAREAQG